MLSCLRFFSVSSPDITGDKLSGPTINHEKTSLSKI
jgi:hypothetical protein